MFEPNGTSHLFRLIIVLGSGLALVAGCAKEEPPKPRETAPAPVAAAPQPASAQPAPRKSVDYMAGLKNIKDESKAVTREELERSARQVVQSAEATKAAMSDPAKPADTRPAPQPVAPAPVAPAPVAQAPAPVQPTRPTAPADDVVAKATPTATAPTTTATPMVRAAPDFPREAVRAGVENGMVHARLTIDAAGNVTNVQIVEARPVRVFDRTVRETLSKWKFNNGADGRTYDTELDFRR